MSQHGVLRISGTGLRGGTEVQLDGQDITNALEGLSLRLGVDNMPTAALDVLLHDVSTEVENPVIVVPEKTHALLVQLGWTPPVNGEQGGES